MTIAMYDEMTAMIVRENARLRAQVAELRAAQTPRPMAEAPRDGTWVILWTAGRWNILCSRGEHWIDDENRVYLANRTSVWLPLPPAPTTEMK
jgi:hypothetical protein